MKARLPTALFALALLGAAGCVGQRVAGGAPAAPAQVAASVVSIRELAGVFQAAGCRECHVAEGAAADTRLVFPLPGAPAAQIDQAAADLADLIDADDPAKSRLLRKPTKRLSHEGGERITPGSAEERKLLAWLTEVSRDRRPDPVAVRALVSPPPLVTPWPLLFDGSPSPLRRLSREELVTSLEVLTGQQIRRSELPDDPRQGHGMLLTAGTPFIANEILQLREAMKDFAVKVTPKILEKSACTQEGQPQRDCLAAFFATFAERAFRRAPLAEERKLWRQLLGDAGKSPAGDQTAVENVLTTIFMAPSFLYRAEVGTPVPDRPGVRALRSDEIATRLAFLATLAPPDAELLAAARAGKLSDGAERVRHFERLSTTDLGRRAQAVFVLEWLGASEEKAGLKSGRYLRNLGRGFEPALRASAEGAIRHVLAESGDPTVTGILTTTAYANDEIIRTITGPARVNRRESGDTADTGRMGLLMHPQVLAAHTKEDGASPFQIGAFIRETLLCEPVPPPPPNAAASARTDAPEGLSMRENLEYRTSAAPVCTGCHKTFSPLGYSFLPFDPIGRWVPADPSGKPWDLSGDARTHSGVPVAFKSPSELVRNLATHPQVHGCFGRAALQWTFGRALVPQDERLVLAVNAVSRSTRGNVIEIFRTIVSSPEFTTTVVTR